jgi:hypothetical protein
MEGISSYTLRSIPSNEFDGLDNTVYNLTRIHGQAIKTSASRSAYLMLYTRIFAFRVFANQYSIHVVVWSLETLNRDTRPNVGEEVEGPSQSQIQRNVSLSNYRILD